MDAGDRRTMKESDRGCTRLVDSLVQLSAEHRSRETSVLTRRGIRSAVLRGLRPGGTAPFGFRIEDRRLAVEEGEAAVIREMAKLRSGIISARSMPTWSWSLAVTVYQSH